MDRSSKFQEKDHNLVVGKEWPICHQNVSGTIMDQKHQILDKKVEQGSVWQHLQGKIWIGARYGNSAEGNHFYMSIWRKHEKGGATQSVNWEKGKVRGNLVEIEV